MNSKMLVTLVSSIVSSTADCTPNLSHRSKVCNTNNIPTVRNMERGEEVIRLKKSKNQDSKGDTSRALKLLEMGGGR